MSATDHPREPFTLTVTGAYKSPTRTKPVTVTATATIPRVAVEQAPKAMTLATRDGTRTGYTVLRSHAGRLYTGYTPNNRGVEPGSLEFPAEARQTFAAAEDWDPRGDIAAQHTAHVEADTGLLCIIGDYLWVEIGEPRYLVHHTGGIEDVDTGGLVFTVAMADAEDFPVSAFFRADQFELAWRYAMTRAEHAGDAAAIRYLHANRANLEVIEVHDPAAVTLVIPVRPPREVEMAQRSYVGAVTVLGTTDDPRDEAEAWAQAVRAREEIVAAGFEPLPSAERPMEGRDHPQDSPRL